MGGAAPKGLVSLVRPEEPDPFARSPAMPRPRSDTPAYCLHKRSNRGYVTLDGRQCWLPGLFNSDESRSAYDRLVGEWLRNGRSLPERISGTAPTVSIVALAFW